eukprot:PhM_4_TR11622/c1_g1_i8/m.29084
MNCGKFVSLALCFVCMCSYVSGAVKAHSSRHDATSIYVTFRIRQQCRIALNEVIPTRAQPSPDLHHITPHDAAILESRKANGSFQHLAMAPAADHSTEHPKMHERKIVLTYRDANDVLTGHVFVDPTRYVSKRAMSGEGVHIGHRHHPGGSHDHPHPAETADASVHDIDEAPHIVYLPPHVRQVMLHCHNASTVTTFRTDRVLHKHRFHASANSGVETDTIQSVGPPDTQFNIVFLSGGYTSAERDMFIANAKTVWHYLSSPTKEAGFDFADTYFSETVPFVRYAPFSNVFWVYQPSAQSGASVKNDNVEVNNNLGCFYPEGANDRGLRCVPDLAIALADVSAARARDNYARTAIIVLVNHKKYGGTGIFAPTYRLGTFSNYFLKYSAGYDPITDTEARSEKTQMMSLVSHEMGHAVGGLMDEYDIGINEDDPRRNRYQNCWMYNDDTVPWGHWRNLSNEGAVKKSVSMFPGSFQSTYQVLSKPIKPCGYSNFWRPVEHCMMSKLNEYFMCPVCREAVTLKMFESPIQFTWPQCPLSGQVVFLKLNERINLYVNSALVSVNDFYVSWSVGAGGTLLECWTGIGTCRRFSASSAGVYVIGVDVVHDSTWVLKGKDSSKYPWKQNTTFTIVVSNDSPSVAVPNTVIDKTVRRDFCGGNKSMPLPHSVASAEYSFTCNASNATANVSCFMKLTAADYVQPKTSSPTLDAAAEYLYWVVVGLCFGCLGLWAWAIHHYRGQNKHIARPIFTTEFTGPVKIIRFIMVTTAVLLMVGSLAVVAAGLVAYDRMGPFGQILLVAGLAVAFNLYILAFVGFWAVENRSKKILMLNGVLLVLSLAAVSVIFGILLNLGENITDNDGFWSKEMTKTWEKMVEDNPNFACQAQIYLKCTGFQYPCDGNKAVSAHCPENCEMNSHPYSPCKTVLEDFILDNYHVIVYACVVVMVASFFAIVFNTVMYIEVRLHKKRISAMMAKRMDAFNDVRPSHRALCVLRTLDTGDTAKLLREFNRIDVDSSGTLDKKEFYTFFHKALCYRPTQEEIDVIFRLADTSNDGEIGVNEFLAIFSQPKKSQQKEGSAVSAVSPYAAPPMPTMQSPLLRGSINPRESIEARVSQEMRSFEKPQPAGRMPQQRATAFSPQQASIYSPPTSLPGVRPMANQFSSGYGGNVHNSNRPPINVNGKYPPSMLQTRSGGPQSSPQRLASPRAGFDLL